LSDWEKISSDDHNVWQKLARRSYGTLTPANLASIVGGIIAIYGLIDVYNGAIVSGLLLLAIGRTADLLDGMIAEFTKTKSPLGELIDVIVDKLVIGLAVVVFLIIGNIPWPIIGFIAGLNLYNGVVGIIGKLRGGTIHPSKFGKYSTALAWVTLIFYPLGYWVKDNESSQTGVILIFVALASFGFYIIFGLLSSLSYGKLLYKLK